MSFFDKYESLCKEKHVSCKKAAVEIGLANSLPTRWKQRGSTPNGETLTKIADYFGVSVSELLDEKEKAPAPEREGLSDLQIEAIELVKQIHDEATLNLLVSALRISLGKTK